MAAYLHRAALRVVGFSSEGGAPKKNSSQADQQESVFYSVAAFSLVSDLIHLWVTPSSFADL